MTSPSLRTAALRIGVSVGLVVGLLAFLPVRTLMAAFAQVSPRVWVFAVIVHVLFHLLAAFKWRILMGRHAGIPLTAVVRAHFAGVIGNLGPLGLIGGDMVRATLAVRWSSRPAVVALASVIDRLVDATALMLLAMAGVLWVGARSAAVRPVLLASFSLAALGVAILGCARWILRKSARDGFAGQLIQALDVLVQRPVLVGGTLCFSVLLQGAILAFIVFLGGVVGVNCMVGAWLIAWPTAKLIGLLPVSVAGIGVRELALIALLRPFGGAAGPVMATGLLWDAVVVASSLIGWLTLGLARNVEPSDRCQLQAL